MKRTTGHPTVAVESFYGDMVDIDEEIAPLIATLWAHGVRTSSSCQQEEGGKPMVGFWGLADMEAFHRLAAEGGFETWGGIDPRAGWEYVLWADGSLRGEVHFPVADLAAVTAAVTSAPIVAAGEDVAE